MLVYVVHKHKIYSITFTFINSPYNNQFLDELLIVICADILYISTISVLP